MLERGADKLWRVRTAMVSAPITIGALVGRVVGVTAISVTGSRVGARCADATVDAPARPSP